MATVISPGLAWRHFVVGTDLAMHSAAGDDFVIPAGETIRVYQGDLLAGSSTLQAALTSPTGVNFLVERSPDGSAGEFWFGYKPDAATQVDQLDGAAYEADTAARRERIGWAPVTPDAATQVDDATSAALDSIGLPGGASGAGAAGVKGPAGGGSAALWMVGAAIAAKLLHLF